MKKYTTVTNTKTTEGIKSVCKEFPAIFGFGKSLEDSEANLVEQISKYEIEKSRIDFSDVPDKYFTAEDLNVTYTTHDLPSGKSYVARCDESPRMGIGRSEELALASLLRSVNRLKFMYDSQQELEAIKVGTLIQTEAYSSDWKVIGLVTVPGWEKSRQIAVLKDMVMTVVYGCHGFCSVCVQRCKQVQLAVQGKSAAMVRSDQFVLVYGKPDDIEPLDYLNQVLGLRAEFRIRY